MLDVKLRGAWRLNGWSYHTMTPLYGPFPSFAIALQHQNYSESIDHQLYEEV